MRYKSKPLFLILGIIVFIAGILVKNYTDEDGVLVAGWIIGTILIITFFLTRKHVVSITPDGGIECSINIEVKGVDKSRIEKFITNIQEAKLARVANK